MRQFTPSSQRSWSRAIAVVAVATLGFSACGSDSTPTDTTPGNSGVGTVTSTGAGSGSGTTTAGSETTAAGGSTSEGSSGSSSGGTDEGSKGNAATCKTAEAGGNLERLCKANKVIVGTKFDQPLFGLKDPTSGKITGFDVEIAKLIAAKLGKQEPQIEFVETVSKVREDVIANGQVDFVVATYTINDERKQKVGFAGPYYVAGQDLMVKAGDTSITGKDSLEGKKVCSVTGSTPEKRLREETKAEVVAFEKYSECAAALTDGRVDAVSTDNVILLGLIQQSGGSFTLVGNPFSKEPYGIGVPLADTELRGFINDVLEASYADGSWAKAYAATVGQVDEKTPEPPAVDRY
jgi:glutamate transport system substrate-binding protein